MNNNPLNWVDPLGLVGLEPISINPFGLEGPLPTISIEPPAPPITTEPIPEPPSPTPPTPIPEQGNGIEFIPEDPPSSNKYITYAVQDTCRYNTKKGGRKDPVGIKNRKKQGRELNQKKRNDNWKPRKKSKGIPKHTPSRKKK
ncbi:MAG: hypothetical protein ACD_79C01405G0004 [uncultured bacterium]|nr:MAG: hypothetical protein ACD_79C01405G0004 [uncultured bacterium]